MIRGGFRPHRAEQRKGEVRRRRLLALTYRIENGQRHHIQTLSGQGAAALFDQFDEDQRGCVRDRYR